MDQTKTIRWLICGLAVSLLVLTLPSTTLAESGGDEKIVIVSGYQISLLFAESLTAGENPVHIQILDKRTGLPVKGAEAAIRTMLMIDPAHAMSGMQGMSHNMGSMGGMNNAPVVTTPNQQPGMEGDYIGILTFPTDGRWMLTTRLNINDQMFTAIFHVNVARSSASLIILLGFIALNAIIIYIASVTHRKPISAIPTGKLI